MNRFEDVSEYVVALVDRVQGQWFPELARARFKVLFDTKRRKSRGNWVLARIQRTNEVMRHLTKEEARSEVGYDYILYLDKAVWEAIDEKDRLRIVRHELRHCFYDIETTTTPYKLVGHDVEDFSDGDRAQQGRPPLAGALRGRGLLPLRLGRPGAGRGGVELRVFQTFPKTFRAISSFA